jgi:uncharacterized protein
MSERDGFQHGVPCWVDIWQDDVEAAAAFYTGLFGWEAQVGDAYTLFTHRGLDAAGAGAPAAGGVAWTTYVWVDDVEAVAARVVEEGGRVVLEPFDSLDGGRMAIVADPADAVFGVWQLGEHRGARVVNEPGAWAMSALSTPDPEGAKAFYGAVFGWETDMFGEVALWRLPGYVGGEPSQPVPRDVIGVTVPMSEDGSTPPQWSVNFWVADADATANAAEKLGGAMVVPPFDTEISRDAVIADPQGAVFSVSTVPGP